MIGLNSTFAAYEISLASIGEGRLHGLVVIPLTVVTIIVGESVPKVFALRNKELVCLTLSPPMEWFSYSVWPAVWFFENTVTGIMRLAGYGGENQEGKTVIQDLHGAAAFARLSRLIGQREEGIIVSASRLLRHIRICIPVTR